MLGSIDYLWREIKEYLWSIWRQFFGRLRKNFSSGSFPSFDFTKVYHSRQLLGMPEPPWEQDAGVPEDHTTACVLETVPKPSFCSGRLRWVELLETEVMAGGASDLLHCAHGWDQKGKSGERINWAQSHDCLGNKTKGSMWRRIQLVTLCPNLRLTGQWEGQLPATSRCLLTFWRSIPGSWGMTIGHLILFLHLGAVSSLAVRLGPDVLGEGFACPNI